MTSDKAQRGLARVRARASLLALLVLLVVEHGVSLLVRSAAAAPASAPTGRVHFRQVVDVRQQLSTLLQDRDGLLWIGTVNNGLYRYDGVELTRYHKGMRGLTSNSIYSIYEDGEGILWMTTGGGGLVALDRRESRFRAYLHDPDEPQSVSGNTSLFLGNQTVVEGANGAIWVATLTGLNRFDKGSGRFFHYRHDPRDAGSLADDRVTALLVDSRAQLWVGTIAGGLARHDARNRRFVHYRHEDSDPNSLADDHVTALYDAGDGILWVGTKAGGLDRFDTANGTFQHHRSDRDDPGSLCENVISSISGDRDGRLWIAHGEASQTCGLSSYDPTSGRFTRYTQADGLSSDTVLDVRQDDRTGTLWVVGYTGTLDAFDREAQKFRLYRHDPLDRNSLSSNFVGPMLAARDGTVWITTAKTGVDRYDPATDTWTNFRHDPQDATTIAASWVHGLYEDPDGFLWIGSEGGAIDRLDPKIGQVVTSYRPDADDPTRAAPARFASTIVPDSDQPDVLWVSRFNDGVSRLDTASGTFSHFDIDGFAFVMHLHDDGRGDLWAPTQGGGLVRFDKRAGRVRARYLHDPEDPHTISSNQVACVVPGADDELWIGTWDSGLSRLDVTSGAFRNYTPSDGFPTSGGIFNIVADDQGNLWLPGSEGLVRFAIASGASKLYGAADGLQDDLFFQAGARTADGQIWIGGVNGVNSFYPHQIRDNPHIPPVLLTSFSSGAGYQPESWPEWTREIRLAADDNSFDFEFAALNYTFPGKNRYAYRLEGIDQGWKDAGHRPFGRYAGLPPGEYTLRLRGSNNDGVWNRAGASVRIVIVPHWWQTWWARTGLAALVLGILAVFIGRRMRALRRRAVTAERLGRYTLLEKIGAGGMGVVYRARHAMLRRPTAIKLLPSVDARDLAMRRFEREVQMTSELSHPNIVVVYDYGRSDEGVFYYAMEYLDGFTLRQLVERFGPQPLGRVIAILRQVCSGLAAAHARGLVHRDIKPGNIFLCRQVTGDDLVKVLDFGLVEEVVEEVQDSEMDSGRPVAGLGSVVGTPAYLAPEAITDPESVSPAADIYALGAVGYFLVTGSLVFTGTTLVEMCGHHLYSAPVPPSERCDEPLPEPFESLILRCLSKRPGERLDARNLERTLAGMQDSASWTRGDAEAFWRQVEDADDADDEREEGLDRVPRNRASDQLDLADASTIQVDWHDRDT